MGLFVKIRIDLIVYKRQFLFSQLGIFIFSSIVITTFNGIGSKKSRFITKLYNFSLRGLPTLDAKKGYYFMDFFDRFI